MALPIKQKRKIFIDPQEKSLSMSTTFEKMKMWVLYGFVISMPTLFIPSFASVFAMPKLIVLRMATWLMALLYGYKVFIESKVSYRKNWINAVWLTYALVGILTTILSIAPLTSIFGAAGRFMGLVTLLHGIALSFFVMNASLTQKNIQNLLTVSFLVATLLAIFGMMQYANIGAELFQWNQNPSERIFATLGHPNHFGAYLGIHMVIGFCFLFNPQKKWKRWLLAMGLCIQAGALFLTGSRGAMGAVIIGVITSVYGIIPQDFWRRKMKKILIVFISLVVAGGIIVAVFNEDIQNIPLIKRSIQTIETWQKGFLPDRLSWWLSSVEMVKRKPLFGYGLSTYREAFNQFRRLDYQIGDGNENIITPEAAHNEYLTIAATQGIVGLGTFLALVVMVLGTLSKSEKREKENNKVLRMALRGALIVQLTQIFISFSVIPTFAFMCLFFGLSGMADQKKVSIRKAIPITFKYIFIVIIFIVISWSGITTWREASADYYIGQAKKSAGQGDSKTALENYQRGTMQKPEEYAYFQDFGDFALQTSGDKNFSASTQLKLLQLAKNSYQKAISINPHHPSTWFNLGGTYWQIFLITDEESYYEKAGEYFKKSIALAPNNQLYPYEVGKKYVQRSESEKNSEKNEEAKKYCRIALEYFDQTLKIRTTYKETEELRKKCVNILLHEIKRLE